MPIPSPSPSQLIWFLHMMPVQFAFIPNQPNPTIRPIPRFTIRKPTRVITYLVSISPVSKGKESGRWDAGCVTATATASDSIPMLDMRLGRGTAVARGGKNKERREAFQKWIGRENKLLQAIRKHTNTYRSFSLSTSRPSRRYPYPSLVGYNTRITNKKLGISEKKKMPNGVLAKQ